MLVQPSDEQRDSRPSTPAFFKRRRRRGNEIGQILLRKGTITPEQLRESLRRQAETGGHVGQILKGMGACDSRALSEALIEQLRVQRTHGKARSLARQAKENPSIGWLRSHSRPGLVRALLALVDLFSLGVPAAIVGAIVSNDALTLPQGYVVAALVPLCMAWFSAVRLYAVTPPSPPDEIRSTWIAITLVYLGAWTVSVTTRLGSFSALAHEAWVLGWALSLLLVPTLRGLLRSTLCKKLWWGVPVVVLGASRIGRAVVATLQARPQLGLKPVAVLDDDRTKHGTVRAVWGENDIVIETARELEDDLDTPSERSAIEQFAEVESVPVVGGLDLAAALAQRLKIHTVVVAMPKMNSEAVLGLIERFADTYTNVLVIPDLFNLTHFGATTRVLGGVLGIDVQRQLLLRGPRLAKRVMDVVLTVIGGLLILPFLVALGLLVRLDSRGSVFYQQKRLGQDGIRFNAYKFRTMYVDADSRLSEILEKNPALQAEFESFHKLANDPRVTRIGRVLRKYSLDELPQIWNVLVGDMSLVGPRPYLEREIPDMDQKEAIVLRVKPGITGIWQVTWRNESTFDERVKLDVEYVRSWSPWLDLYVLARTVPVVLGGTGT